MCRTNTRTVETGGGIASSTDMRVGVGGVVAGWEI